MEPNKLMGDNGGDVVLQELQISFWLFGDISAAGATERRQSEGHRRRRDEGEENEEEQIESSPGRTQTGRTHTSTEQLISHLSCLQAVHLSAGGSNPKTRGVQT